METGKKKSARKTRTRRVSRKPFEPRERAGDALVVVYTSAGPLAAEIAKSKLASEGIEAMLKSEAQSAFALTVDGMGEVQVLVRAEDARKAQRILKV